MAMIGRTRALDPKTLRRLCVMCGYDGALLRGGDARRCARCGGDLRSRPARSYAEMEGLVSSPPPGRPAPAQPEDRILQRWLAFLFFAIVALAIAVYLFAASIPV